MSPLLGIFGPSFSPSGPSRPFHHHSTTFLASLTCQLAEWTNEWLPPQRFAALASGVSSYAPLAKCALTIEELQWATRPKIDGLLNITQVCDDSA
jgi:hypothetical protein